jgi:hypothetical protein
MPATPEEKIIFQNYKIYFGDLHSHTGYSDGYSTPNLVYKNVSSLNLADFFSISDHNHLLDKNKWNKTLEVEKKYTYDTFICLTGVEMTFDWGHINLFNCYDWEIIKKNYSMKEFYSLLDKNKDFIAVWNHPCDNTDKFQNFTSLGFKNIDKVINLIDYKNLCIGSQKNFFEEYVKCLDRGWHIAPIGVSDNHNSDWIWGYSLRTAIISERLNKQDLFNSIKNHRVYVTENANLKIFFSINGHAIGSKLNNIKKCDFRIMVNDEDTNNSSEKIKEVQIISNTGRVVFVKKCNSHNISISKNIIPNKNNTYYFLRIYNYKNETAVTAPIWIKNVTLN